MDKNEQLRKLIIRRAETSDVLPLGESLNSNR
jgi:hypothetical protein